MFRLVFHLSGDTNEPLPLPEAQPLTLGRGEDNAIYVNHDTVSRHHARLSPAADGTWIIEDLRSSNGVRLNGQRLARAQPLKEGDEVRFGDVAATYRQATPDELARDAAAEGDAAPAVGRLFAARYRLNATLDAPSGGDGYRAADLWREGQTVGLHIFPPGVVEAAGGLREMTARFDAIRAAPAHPGLVPLLDLAGWRGTAYLAAGWTDGYPFHEVLQRRAPLGFHEALRIARHAAAATTHARAHRLPCPDLRPQTFRLAFDPPLGKKGAWEKLLHRPVDRWPAFLLTILPCLGAPEPGYPFGALLGELLGAPPAEARAASGSGVRPPPMRIPALGEAGNAVLARGLVSRGEAFGGDTAFVETLAHAVDPRAYG